MNQSYTTLVTQCRSLSKKTLSVLLRGFFDKLDDALYDVSEKSEGGLKTDYLQAMRDVRKDRQTIESTFNKQIFDGFDAFWSEEDEFSNNEEEESTGFDFGSLGELSLVDDDDMEESLAITNMAGKVENKFAEEILALNKRFGLLLEQEVIKSDVNPLGPKALADSFLNAMTKLTLEVSEEENELTIKLVIYKNFDLHFFKYIGAFYDEINTLLHAAGIDQQKPAKFRQNPVSPAAPPPPPPEQPIEEAEQLHPDPQYPVQQGQQSPYPQQQQQQQPMGTMPPQEPAYIPPPMYGYAQNYQAPAFNQLTQLMHQQPMAPSGMVNPTMPALPPQQLSSMVAGMQNQALMAGGSIGDLRGNIQKTLHETTTEHSIKQEDQDAIDVISMLFEFILDDPNLPDKMRALLSKLQIPMLKVAILDKTFFTNKNHPARTLLNNLAQASVGIVDNDPLHKPLIRRIEAVIGRIVDEFKNDVSLFSLLDDEFSLFIEKENKMAKVTETRTAQATQGQDKRKLVKAKVAEAINSRVKGKRLPRVVKKLLKEPWNNLLNLAYLRGGEENEQWQKALAVIDKLSWTLSGTKDQDERKKIIKAVPALLIEIREGLKTISYNQQEMTSLLKGLQEAHVVSLRESSANEADRKVKKEHSPEIAEAIVVEEVAEDEELVESPIQIKENEGDNETGDEFLQKAREMEVGTWLEWDNTEGKHLRGKLSWKSDVTGIFVFVNRKGMKIAEMQADGLAELLKNEKAIDLQDTAVPLMDRALTAMVDVLKKSAEVTESMQGD